MLKYKVPHCLNISYNLLVLEVHKMAGTVALIIFSTQRKLLKET